MVFFLNLCRPNFPEKINTIEENFKIETSIFPGYVVEHFQKSFLRKYVRYLLII
jgi:hypothetical protein